MSAVTKSRIANDRPTYRSIGCRAAAHNVLLIHFLGIGLPNLHIDYDVCTLLTESIGRDSKTKKQKNLTFVALSCTRIL